MASKYRKYKIDKMMKSSAQPPAPVSSMVSLGLRAFRGGAMSARGRAMSAHGGVMSAHGGVMSACLLVCISLCGCGSGGPFSYVKVSGKITYEDGSPLPVEAMRLIFVSDAPPVDGNFHPREGIAYIDADGNFDSVTSYKYGDGLIPGKHKVFFETITRQGNLIASAEYGDPVTSPLEVDTADSPLNIKIPKPAKRTKKKSR